MSTHTKGAPWPRLSAAPAFSYKVKGGRKVVGLYDRCHLAWRAGLIDGWYYGRRSPIDPTIVWELNGTESEPECISADLELVLTGAGVASIEWGGWWCGYRSIVVTYEDGRRVSEVFDGTAVRLEEAS